MTTTSPRDRGSNARTAPLDRGTNLAVLRGTVAADPITRDLPAGGVVVQFDVITPVVDDSRTSAHATPVAWYDPQPPGAPVAGAEVVVIGSVRRRFFRVGGATQSRTEVRADRVLETRRRRTVDAALADVVRRLGAGG
jgi:single-strand DNA-binding protein